MGNLKIKDFKIIEHPIKYEGSNSLFLHGQTIVEGEKIIKMEAKYYRHKNLEIFCKVISEKEMVRVENYKDEIVISFWDNRHLVENVLKTYEKSDAQVFKREYDKAVNFLNERV